MTGLRDANIALVTRYYEALAAGDFDALAALHADDVVFNLVGSTPVSGRWVGKAECFGPVVADGVIGKLVADTIRFSRQWRIMCADENCVVGLMRGGGMGTNGHEYLQTYCQVLTIRDGLIAEEWVKQTFSIVASNPRKSSRIRVLRRSSVSQRPSQAAW